MSAIIYGILGKFGVLEMLIFMADEENSPKFLFI